MKQRIIIYGVNYFPPKGGTSRVVENLIIQLKADYDITICCYRNNQAKTHLSGVRVIEFTQWARGSIGSLLYFFLSALHLLFFEKAALVHAHKTDCAFFIPLLRLRFKVVATSHEAPYKRDKWNKLQRLYFHISERIFVLSANICTCISRPLAAYYHQKYKRQVTFIPNGINLTEKKSFDPVKAASFLPQGADINKPFILFSARRLMATKGCHTMLSALKLTGFNGQIFIAGELDGSAYIKRLRELSAGMQVFFIGFVEPLSALLALIDASKIFVFPSETEGMSVMLLEVASAGKPVIASDIPENKQLFSDNEVLYFQSQNASELAEKIKYALSNNAEMVLLGANAQKLVFSNYLWSDISKEYARIYSSI